MIKNKITHVVYQTIYCIIALIGIIASLGYFNGEFKSNFYIYYTNLSNYICAVFMFVLLVNSVKTANKKQDGVCKIAPAFNFLCVIMILVTFLVYNILLAKEHTVLEYFTSVSNLSLHVILPVMFVLNWFLFCSHGKLKIFHPLLCMIMPLIYVCFIVIRAMITTSGKMTLGSYTNSNKIIYPYFFLNIEKLGWNNFFVWISVLLTVFIIIGYLFLFFDSKIKKLCNKY